MRIKSAGVGEKTEGIRIEKQQRIGTREFIAISGRLRVNTTIPVELSQIAGARGIRFSYALAHGIRDLVRKQQGSSQYADSEAKIARLQRLFEQQAQENYNLKERISFIEKQVR